MKLTALKVEQLTKEGRYADGGGLYLQVRSKQNKSWLLRYMFNYRQRHMGLGEYPEISLARARELALQHRSILKDPDNPRDPLEVRDEQKRLLRQKASKRLNFSEATEQFIEQNKAGWSNAKHESQWRNTLTLYAYPVIGETPVDQIDRHAVLQILNPIWASKNETASRVRGRIEKILNWCNATGIEMPENPAQWKGHLDHILPKPSKVKKEEHHPALPIDQVPAFFDELSQRSGTAARALEFTILTACRTNEVTESRWEEFDLGKKVWTIPKERMKTKKEHRVPLTASAMEILDQMNELGSPYVFPSNQMSKHLSNNGMLALILRMHKSRVLEDGKGWVDEKGRKITAHGFRSTFRDWAGEYTNHSREVIEHAIAHQLKDKAEAAYARGDLFNKRRGLMDEWSSFCSAQTS